jgi:DUF971 family protein
LTPPWPRALRAVEDGRILAVTFETGEMVRLAALDLRRLSPSAEGRGHGPSAPPRPAASFADAKIVSLDPVGRYAVRIGFADGHDTGLFTWAFLHDLAHRSGK